MRAIEAETLTGYAGLRQVELPKPQRTKDKALVHITAAGVTPLDHTILSGGHPRAKPPLVLGNEGAGVIEDAGASDLEVGSRVMFTGPYGVGENGAWQDWLLVRPKHLALVPDAIDDIVAASLPVAYLTAQVTLTLAGFKPGMTVLAPGIGGSVGNATSQLARAEGAGKVISTAGSAAKAAKARELGFEDVVDLSKEGLAEGVRRITAGKGVDIVIESIGGTVTSEALSSLGSGGVLITLGYSAGRKTTIDVTDPDLEAGADGRLLAVRPIANRDRRRVAGYPPADRQRIRQAPRRAGLSPQRGGRSTTPPDRGSAIWQSHLGGLSAIGVVP
jgi:NADPH:quinone reductase